MDDHRTGGYTSIHERRLELIERAMLGPRRTEYGSISAEVDEMVEIDSVAGLIAGIVGTAIQGVSAVFPFLLAAFAAPLWFLIVQYIFWAGGMALAVRLRAQHPWLTLATPIVSISVWGLVLSAGTGALGWPTLRF